MTSCCEIDTQSEKIRKVLWVTLWINLIVFFGQFIASIIANSTALLADSIDMVGDAIAYGISLYALNRGKAWIAKAALYKGVIIGILACIVFAEAFKKIFMTEVIPSTNVMLLFSIIGLIANAICFSLLTTYKDENLNMKSIWICSKNDMMVNVSVIITAFLVSILHSQWPDVIVGLGLAFLLLKSALHIIGLSLNKLSLDKKIAADSFSQN